MKYAVKWVRDDGDPRFLAAQREDGGIMWGLLAEARLFEKYEDAAEALQKRWEFAANEARVAHSPKFMYHKTKTMTIVGVEVFPNEEYERTSLGADDVAFYAIYSVRDGVLDVPPEDVPDGKRYGTLLQVVERIDELWDKGVVGSHEVIAFRKLSNKGRREVPLKGDTYA